VNVNRNRNLNILEIARLSPKEAKFACFRRKLGDFWATVVSTFFEERQILVNSYTFLVVLFNPLRIGALSHLIPKYVKG